MLSTTPCAGDGASEMRDVVLIRKPDSEERAGLKAPCGYTAYLISPGAKAVSIKDEGTNNF